MLPEYEAGKTRWPSCHANPFLLFLSAVAHKTFFHLLDTLVGPNNHYMYPSINMLIFSLSPFVEQQQHRKEDREMNFNIQNSFFMTKLFFLIHFSVHERKESKALNMNQTKEMEAKKKQKGKLRRENIITKLSNASNIASKHITKAECIGEWMESWDDKAKQTNCVAVYADGCCYGS